MNKRSPANRGMSPPSSLTNVIRSFGLVLPAFLLLIAAMRAPDQGNLVLWLGTAFQLLVCLLTSLSSRGARQPIGPSVVTLYLVALGWLWLGTYQQPDWYTHLAKAVLLVIPLLSFAHQMLTESGAPAIRRARQLADRLLARKDWPELAACRTLPEVKAFREAIHRDPSPALALLHHARPQVQLAALAALEFRKDWQPGQAELILTTAQRAPEPLVRAAAVAALGNVDERLLIEAMAEFLRDPAREVRAAATEALLWDSETRWPWIRNAVRRALSDPICRDDGPLRHEGQMLTGEAVSDIRAWVAQKGLLGYRAALTLGVHYSRALNENPSQDLIIEMRAQLASPHTPAPLRMELARLLQGCNALATDTLEDMLGADNPAPVRLLATEMLLDADVNHRQAIRVLHQLGRLPNREIALATADLVQRKLGVDVGLALHEALPPIYSRQAAEVARRIMIWATQADARDREIEVRERQPTA